MTEPSGEPQRRVIENSVVQITSMTVTTDQIRNIDFVNCEIVGPAVITPIRCSFIESSFEGPPESIAVVVEAGKPALRGTVVAIDCRFIRSRMTRIGFAATSDFVQMIRSLPKGEQNDDRRR